MAITDKYLNYPKGRGATWSDDGQRLRKPDGTEVLLGSGVSLVVDAISQVDAVALGLSDGVVLVARGRATAGDGGGGVFTYASSSAQPADGGLVFAPTAGAGRLIRWGWTVLGFAGGIDPVWYGADPSGAADSTAAINAALAAFGANGNRVVTPSPGAYKISAALSIYPRTVLDGGSRDACKIVIQQFADRTDAAVKNAVVDGSSPALGSPGIVIRCIEFDGTARVFPDYLSKLDGTPITDPQADYRAGGCLAPTSIATCTPVLSGGGIASVTPISAGLGYVAPPVCWITGNGTGASVVANWDAGTGQVTGYTVRRAGQGYTTCAIEVAGGGAPQATLYTADRRNPGYGETAACIALRKCAAPIIELCRFSNFRGNCINDAGCDGMTVWRNEFIDCGKSDTVGNCIWSQSYGSTSTMPAYFRWSTNTTFQENTVLRQKRSVALVGGFGFRAIGNTIDGWKESAFFVTQQQSGTQLLWNRAKNGDISDITCTFAEVGREQGFFALGNETQDINGPAFVIRASGAEFLEHKHTATKSYLGDTLPFGPIGERTGTSQAGKRPVCGTNDPDSASCIFRIHDADSDPLNAPFGVQIRGGRVIDAGGYIPYVLHMGNGAANSVKEILIEGVDITQAPLTQLFDPAVIDGVVSATSHFRVTNCPGHPSMGGVTTTQTITAGTTGAVRLVAGYRPSLAVITVEGTGGNAGEAIAAEYTDDGANTGTITLTSAAGATIFSATLGVAASNGINLSVTTCTADVTVTMQAAP